MYLNISTKTARVKELRRQLSLIWLTIVELCRKFPLELKLYGIPTLYTGSQSPVLELVGTPAFFFFPAKSVVLFEELTYSGLVQPIANSARGEYSTWGTGVRPGVVAEKHIPGCRGKVGS